MRFFLDECIPKSALDMLTGHGHEASPITNYVPSGSPDQLVATISEENDAILVSHDRDFRKLAPRVMDNQQKRFRRLSIIKMECKEPRIAQRLEYNLAVVDFEYQQRQNMPDQRLIMTIRTDTVRIDR